MKTKLILVIILITIIQKTASIPRLDRCTNPDHNDNTCYGSTEGGTLVYIYGDGFTQDEFGIVPSDEGVYTIHLINNQDLFECKLQRELTSSNRLACYTPALRAQNYEIVVYFNDRVIYWTNYWESYRRTLSVSSSYTPQIHGIIPLSGFPQRLLRITGDFKTDIFIVAAENLSPNRVARISRIYIGNYLCELINSTTNELYQRLSGTELTCLLDSSAIGIFNVSMIVTGRYGRSKTETNLQRISGLGQTYHIETYAVVSQVSPSYGSTQGGSELTITGNYFSNHSQQVLRVNIADSPCIITDVNAQRIQCITSPTTNNNNRMHFHGGRGLHIYLENNYTDLLTTENSSIPQPSLNTTPIFTNEAAINFAGSSPKTAWMIGYIRPQANTTFRFIISTNEAASVLRLSSDEYPDNMTVIANSSQLQSNNIFLMKDHNYYFHFVCSTFNRPLSFTIKAEITIENAPFNAGMNGVRATQRINIGGDPVEEHQLIRYNRLEINMDEGESQDIETTTDWFQIGFQGAYTRLLRASASVFEVESALNDLPTIYPLSVRVTVVHTSYRVFFPIRMGNIPPLVVISKEFPNPRNATEITSGPDAASHISFNFDGSVTAYIDFSNNEDLTSLLRDEMENLFTIRCPQSLYNPAATTDIVYVNEFEHNYRYDPEQLIENVAFCGRAASTSYALVTGNGRIGQILCFAYKIPFNSSVSMETHVNINGESTITTDRVILNLDTNNEWHYTCLDLQETLERQNSDYFAANFLVVGYINIYSSQGGLYDTVTVRTAYPPTYESDTLSGNQNDQSSSNMCRFPFSYRGRNYTKCVLDDDLLPICGFNGNQKLYCQTSSIEGIQRILPKFKLISGYPQVVHFQSSNTIHVRFRYTNCDQASLIKTLPSQSANVSSITRASQTVNGIYSLAFKNYTYQSIPVRSEPISLKSLLEESITFGYARVTNPRAECSQYIFDIEWLSYGAQPLMRVTNSSGVQPVGTNITVTSLRSGSITITSYNLPTDILRTHHRSPQLEVLVGSSPAYCENENNECSFHYSTDETPRIISMQHIMNTLTLIGVDLSSSNGTVSITIGERGTCEINQSNNTFIRCTIGNLPCGQHSVRVFLSDKGFARFDGVLDTINISMTLRSIQPSEGSIQGGYPMIINGTGFSSDTRVTIGGNPCIQLQVINFNSLLCQVPVSNVLNTTQVIVLINNDICRASLSSNFTYNRTNGPTISNIHPDSHSVAGGLVNITGSGFGGQIWSVTISNITVTILSSSTNHILINVTQIRPGRHIIKVNTSTGVAISTFYYKSEFYIQNVYPQVGSLFGANDIYVRGVGFDNRTRIELVDSSYKRNECLIKSITSTMIHCISPQYLTQITITSSGIHPIYGIGWTWSSTHQIVEQGSVVTWQWSSPPRATPLSYRIQQIENSGSTIPVENGFDSGTATPSGSFSFQFNVIGTYYYWSPNFAESSTDTFMRGLVQVVPAQSRLLNVQAVSNGFTAQKCQFPFLYEGVNYTECVNQSDTRFWCSPTSIYDGYRLYCTPTVEIPSSNCTSTILNASACDVQILDQLKSDEYVTTLCSIESVESIEPSVGSASTIVTITGQHFSGDECEYQINIGSYRCPLINKTSTQLKCQINDGSLLDPTVLHQVHVIRKHQGQLIHNQDLYFHFLPSIRNITPSSGSTAGGTLVTIDGDGFVQSSTRIVIGNITYNRIVNISNSQIKFITDPRYTQINENLNFNIFVEQFRARCRLSSCTFTWSNGTTPYLTNVTPTSIRNSTILRLNGINLLASGVVISDVRIEINNHICQVMNITVQSIDCFIEALEAGTHSIRGYIHGIGNIVSSLNITSLSDITSVSPQLCGIYGGTIMTIVGNGFSNDISHVQVEIGTSTCTIIETRAAVIRCIIPARGSQPDSVVVRIRLNGNYFTSDFLLNYTSNITPIISNVFVSNSSLPRILTINGSNFIRNQTTVRVGSRPCSISNMTESLIICQIHVNQSAGIHPIVVHVTNVGNSNDNETFYQELLVNNLTPNEIGLGGGVPIEISGHGFDGTRVRANVCHINCTQLRVLSNEHISCLTPRFEFNDTNESCNLTLNVDGIEVQRPIHIRINLTATITSISPNRGGTGGGTVVTIVGTNFPNNTQAVDVSIDNIRCTVESINSTNIVCRTGSTHRTNLRAIVRVFVNTSGNALNTVFFQYVDRWSSRWSWGGDQPPEADSIVSIEDGVTILLDISTPKLKVLVINDSTLMFDDSQDITLNAEYIIIVNNGHLQVGTESEPYQHRGIIKLHGHLRSLELPIYGAKVLALRNGTLDMHGKPTLKSWTRLSTTADVGSTIIELVDQVDWVNGSQIVIATTSDRFSQRESEVRQIINVASDNRTLILNAPLNYKHLGVSLDINGTIIEMRAEVGLLSHNVIFEGSVTETWDQFIEECPEQFNPDEFAVQSCFLGRYGSEVGSDQVGAMIMASSGVYSRDSEQPIVVRLSNVEIFHVGQAFRLDRYAVHFDLNGNMSLSYIKSSSIHESYNRAVYLKATNGFTFDDNVVYNIMGSALMLSSGVEMHNVFTNNLVVFVKSSSSLQNVDLTPAAFWLSNPNNRLENNAIAGVSHYGYWYRLQNEDLDPPYVNTNNIIANQQRLGSFINNSVHSTGRYGLWIHDIYTPMATDSNNARYALQAVYEGLVAWRNRKGMEYTRSNSIQIKNALVFDNEESGIICAAAVGYDDLNPPFYRSTFYKTNNGSSIINSVIIGYLNESHSNVTMSRKGLVVLWDRGLIVDNVTFINFPYIQSLAITKPDVIYTCDINCAGWTTKFRNLNFINVQTRSSYRWAYETLYYDIDGSLSGVNDSVIMYPDNFTRNLTTCSEIATISNSIRCSMSAGTWVRVGIGFWDRWLMPVPYGLTIYDINNVSVDLTQSHDSISYRKFVIFLRLNQTYRLHFNGVNNYFNARYRLIVYDLPPGSSLIFEHENQPEPHSSMHSVTNYPLSNENITHGSFHYDNVTRTYSFIAKNAYGSSSETDVEIYVRMHNCPHFNCVTPTTVTTITPPVTYTINPGHENQNEQQCSVISTRFWSNASDWTFGPQEYLNWNGTKPLDNQNIYIPRCIRLVIDEPIPRIQSLRIDGVLEFQQGLHHEMRVSAIVLFGGVLIAGEPGTPFNGTVKIYMDDRGPISMFPSNNIPLVQPKMIGIYGRLDLQGRDSVRSWTRLAITARTGETTLVLSEVVYWNVGDEIIITTTDNNIENTERHRITRILNGTIVEIAERLLHDHLVIRESLTHGEVNIAAAVGLLSHNIQIINVQSSSNDLTGIRLHIGQHWTSLYYNFLPGPVLTYFKGYARLSNVQFIGFGTSGYSSNTDHLAGIYLNNLGDYNPARQMNIDKCSFDGGFNTAITMENTHGHSITNNVIYRTYRSGIVVTGRTNTLDRNLVSTIYWPGRLQSSFQAQLNLNYDAAIDSRLATSVTMTNNLVAGVDRLGYRIQGNACTRTQAPSSIQYNFRNNEVHSAMSGVNVWPLDKIFAPDRYCLMISGFTTYKAWYYGFYINTARNITIDSCQSIDSQVGIFTFIIGQPPTTRVVLSNRVIIQNSIIVGAISDNTCSDNIDWNSNNIIYSTSAIPTVHIDSNTSKILGRSGIVFPTVSRYNKMPSASWTQITHYPSLDGSMFINNTTFAYFNNICNRTDIAIQVSQSNDDGQFPIKTSDTRTYMVSDSNIIFNGEPNLKKVNPSDCGDMDCDGLKKNLLIDTDGSLFGSPTSVISPSNNFWGNQQHGIGDFRIPRIVMTNQTGHYFNISLTHPYRGIARQNSCELIPSWRMYRCHNTTNYRMLIIENMDSDSETRRISPVAIVSESGYIDLINGPQYRRFGFGYSSRRRISTFMAVVHSHQTYKIYFTGSVPKNTRFRIIDGDQSIKLILALRIDSLQQIDVYANAFYKNPTNRNLSSAELVLNDEPNRVSLSSNPGDNYFDRTEQLVYFAIDGNTTVEVKISPSISLGFSFPPMNPSVFYSSDLPRKLAALFRISVSKIRRTRIVADGSSGRRRRRQSSRVTLYIDIRDEPRQISIGSGGVLDEVLSNIASSVINRCQTGELFTSWLAQNVTADVIPSGASVQEPYENRFYNLNIIDHIVLVTRPSDCRQNTPCGIQPVLVAYDSNNTVIERLGSVERPWQIQATIVNQSNVTIYGGIANYTGYQTQYRLFSLSQIGSYEIKFAFIRPDGTSSSIFLSTGLNVEEETDVSQARLTAEQLNHIYRVQLNQTFSISARPVDQGTNLPLARVRWGNWTWRATVTLYQLPRHNREGSLMTLNGANLTINRAETMVTLYGLRINSTGMYVLNVSMKSTDGQHSISLISNGILVQETVDDSVVEIEDLLSSITFIGDYNNLNVSNQLEISRAMIYNYLISVGLPLTTDIVLVEGDPIDDSLNSTSRSLTSSSTVVALFQVDTTSSNLSSSISTIQANQYSVPNLRTYSVNINGRSFLADSSNSAESKEQQNWNRNGLIIGLTVGLGLLLLIVGIAISAWRVHVNNNEKRCKTMPTQEDNMTSLKTSPSRDDLNEIQENPTPIEHQPSPKLTRPESAYSIGTIISFHPKGNENVMPKRMVMDEIQLIDFD